jgi:hypothetical protein
MMRTRAGITEAMESDTGSCFKGRISEAAVQIHHRERK